MTSSILQKTNDTGPTTDRTGISENIVQDAGYLVFDGRSSIHEYLDPVFDTLSLSNDMGSCSSEIVHASADQIPTIGNGIETGQRSDIPKEFYFGRVPVGLHFEDSENIPTLQLLDPMLDISATMIRKWYEDACSDSGAPNSAAIREIIETTDWADESQAMPTFLRLRLLTNDAIDPATASSVDLIINNTDWSGPDAIPEYVNAYLLMHPDIQQEYRDQIDMIISGTDWMNADNSAASSTLLGNIIRQNIFGASPILDIESWNYTAISETLTEHPLSIQYFPEEVRNDQELVLTAAEQDANALDFASEALRNDREFILAALKIDPGFWAGVPESLKGDAIFCRQAAFAVLDIDHPIRLMNQEEMIRNRYSVAGQEERTALEAILGPVYFEGVENDTRPLCVIIYPDDDWNGVMSVTQTDMLSEAYRVIYYDVSTDEELVNDIRQATIDSGQQASLLILTGHGTREGMTLGSEPDESSYMALADTNLIARLQGCVEDNGHVILQSCSTGEGKDPTDGIDNFAEFVHSIWPNAWTHAPTGDESNMILLDENGEFVSPGFFVRSSLLDPEFVIPPDGRSSLSYYLNLFRNVISDFPSNINRWLHEIQLKMFEYVVKVPELVISMVQDALERLGIRINL